MKTQREKAIYNYFSPHMVKDVADLYAMLATDITIVEPEVLPWGGNYHGLQGVGNYMVNVSQSIMSEITLDEVYSCGDKVVAIGWSSGRTLKSGKPFQIRVTQLFTFNEENKINRVEFLADLPAFAEALELNFSSS
jgi:ketosteroid isomerase-like protein